MKFKSKYTGTQIENKLDNVEAKFTATEKTKLANLENYDDSEIKADVEAVQTSLDTVNQNISELQETTEQNQSDISDLQSDVATAQDDIVTLQTTAKTTSTEIASIKNNVAINRTTLGVQCKNLLPFLTSITKKGIVFSCNALGYMSASSTDYDDRQWTYDMAQYSVRLQPGDYILSFHSSTVCTNAYGNIMVLSADSTKLCNIGQSNYVNNTTGVATFTITTEQTVYVMSKVFDGITAIMIRHADITDDTYEPYQPSLQEQVTALTERIVALESALTTATTQEA